ncbi:hypothetical protein PZ938_03135 [Luteipulveratus sp. YIM 133132]|uniref:DUF7426 family protein n=1 Tax=Luteipulveratus flavus TaxID=3031728 RepID=UPI0023AF7E4E|nr:hypothetical protein [Luteipulveratus sp. YIM 133132]MDE9364587.1 hypothetical protein [Luteipulveratus sp. YIM 133132]
MALQMKALSEAVADGALDFPINGKTYTAPAVSAEVGLQAQRFMHLARMEGKHDRDVAAAKARGEDIALSVEYDAEDQALLDDWTVPETLFENMLGSALDEMYADRVPFALVARAAQTMFMYVTSGEEAAAQAWAGDDSGKAAETTQLRRPGSKARSTKTASPSTSSRTRRSPSGSPAKRRTGPTSSSSGS